MEHNISTTIGSRISNNNQYISVDKVLGFTEPTTMDVNNTQGGQPMIDISNDEALEMTRFVVQRVLIPLVVMFGTVGNIASIIVLTNKSMKTSTNCYLTALAVFDLLYLTSSFILSLKHYGDLYEKQEFLYVYIVVRVMSDMWSNVSVCLTVTFTVERWIAVCHPMKGRVICTPKRARMIATFVSVTAILCVVPECFEWKVVEKVSENKTMYKIRPTDVAQTDSYSVGYYWFLVVGFSFLPLIALCLFNIILIRAVCQASNLRRRMTYAAVSRPNERNQGDQNRITCMLIGVALVFIFCQFPTAAMIIYYAHLNMTEKELTSFEINNLRIAGNITNLLLSVNAAINFVLYSAMSTKFRKLFIKIFCKCLGKQKFRQSFSDYSDVTGMSYMKRSSTFRSGYNAKNSKEDIIRSSSQSSMSSRKRFLRNGSPVVCSDDAMKSSESLMTREKAPRPLSAPLHFNDTIL